jgi:hypothetical protein
MVGKSFGKLKVVSEAPPTKSKVKRWYCLCSCGNKTVCTEYNLVHGITQSCGCLNREQDLTGKKFGKLTVLKRAHNIKEKKAWLCACSCGNQVIVKANHLKTENTQSCGCLKKKRDLTNLKLYRKIKSEKELIYRLFKKYKVQASLRGLGFDLNFEFFKNTINKNCFYCDGNPENTIKSVGFKIKYSGIDRVDNSRGYTQDNCVPCCSKCNNAKKDHSIEEFRNWSLNFGKNIHLIGPFNGN